MSKKKREDVPAEIPLPGRVPEVRPEEPPEEPVIPGPGPEPGPTREPERPSPDRPLPDRPLPDRPSPDEPARPTSGRARGTRHGVHNPGYRGNHSPAFWRFRLDRLWSFRLHRQLHGLFGCFPPHLSYYEPPPGSRSRAMSMEFTWSIMFSFFGCSICSFRLRFRRYLNLP